MSNVKETLSILLDGLHSLGDVTEEDFQTEFENFLSELPREVSEPDTLFDESTQASPIEERIGVVEDEISKLKNPLESDTSDVMRDLVGNSSGETTEVMYGVLQGGAIDDVDLDHIDVKPSSITGTLNTDLGQIAIGVSADGETRTVKLAASAVVKFLRLNRPGVTESSATTIYGLMIGASGSSVEGSGGKGPMFFEKWYDLLGDMAWTDVDTRDWSNRFIEIAAGDNQNAPKDDAVWSEYFDYWVYQSGTPYAWVAQEERRFTRIHLIGDGTAQNILRSETAGTKFYLRMNTTGHLQIRVIDWDVEFNVKIWIRAGKQLNASDAIEIT
jgi:hypothetical protein